LSKIKKVKRTITTLDTGIVKAAISYNENMYEALTSIKQKFNMQNSKTVKFALAIADSVLKTKKVPTSSELETISNSIVSRSKEPNSKESIKLVSELITVLKTVIDNKDRHYLNASIKNALGYMIIPYRKYSKK